MTGFESSGLPAASARMSSSTSKSVHTKFKFIR
jgi:hypothetical protein